MKSTRTKLSKGIIASVVICFLTINVNAASSFHLFQEDKMGKMDKMNHGKMSKKQKRKMAKMDHGKMEKMEKMEKVRVGS